MIKTDCYTCKYEGKCDRLSPYSTFECLTGCLGYVIKGNHAEEY